MGRIYSNSPIFFTSTRLFRKENIVFCTATIFFDYNSTDFLQIIEKNSGVGGVNGHRFAII